MKTPLSITSILTAMTLTLATGVSALEWTVPEKTLSISAGLSPPVQAGLTAMGPPNVAMITTNLPQTVDGWRAFLEELDKSKPVTFENV
jgi:hypothetical protein